MDVGQLNADHTSFDLDNLDETNSVITRTSTSTTKKIRWLYKDEENRLVVLEKTNPIKTAFERGTLLRISTVLDGVAEPKHSQDKETATTVGKLAINIDFENPGALAQKTITDANGVSHICLLCPVILS